MLVITGGIMLMRKLIIFIRWVVSTLKDRPQSEDIKSVNVTVRRPTMYRVKYGMPKIIHRR